MKITDYLSKQEFAAFRQRSDLRGAWQVFVNYTLIASAFALFILWPNPFTAILGAMLLAGRILGLGILMHDAAHNTLFKKSATNALIGRWLLAGPMLGDLESYRKGHLAHHRYAGTEQDPDIPFVIGYPAAKASMRRKFTRDLSGKNGLRDLAFQVKVSSLRKRLPFLASHMTMVAILWASGAPAAYLLWWAGYLFFFPAFMRLRVMGEHGAVADHFASDPRNNTRTTLANPLERLFFCPNFVNFHCEHHVAASVPGHQLPRMHRVLKERGFYKEHPWALEPGYWRVIKKCIGEGGRPGAYREGEASMANMS